MPRSGDVGKGPDEVLASIAHRVSSRYNEEGRVMRVSMERLLGGSIFE
jgi:hypothetical protein